jgi:exopolysaccharide production protein ExoQ
MNLRALAYCFWAVFITRLALAFLFFQDQPKVATFLHALISLAFAFVLVALRLCTHQSFPELPRARVMKWVILYLAWCGLSLKWTFSDAFLSAFGYWAMMLLDICVVLLMLKWDDIEGISIASLKGFVTGVYLIDAIALLFAKNEDGRLGDLDFLHPNGLGQLTSLGALISFFFWQRAPERTFERRAWSAGSAVLSWMVIRTLSKTSIIAFTVAAFFAIILGSNFQLKRKLQILFVSVVLVLLSYGFVNQYLATYLDENPDVTTMTGRTILWLKSWDMIVERPMTGYGFLSFRNYGPQYWDIRITHGHNEWVTQAFQLGFVGVCLTAMIYFSFYRQCRKVKNLLQRKLAFSILVFILIQSMAEAEAVGLLFPLPLLVLLAIWTAPRSESAKMVASQEEPVLLLC